MGTFSMMVSLFLSLQNNSSVVANQELYQNRCNCVTFVREARGGNLPFGLYSKWSKKQIVNSEPVVGSAIITTEGRAGHVGIVVGVTTSDVYIVEANYQHCRISTRILSLDSPQIIGYYN
jgi:surface antigen